MNSISVVGKNLVVHSLYGRVDMGFDNMDCFLVVKRRLFIYMAHRAYVTRFFYFLKKIKIDFEIGHFLDLEVKGMGFMFEVRGRRVTITLEYSHLIHYMLPKYVYYKCEKKRLMLWCINENLLALLRDRFLTFGRISKYKDKGMKIYGSDLSLRVRREKK